MRRRLSVAMLGCLMLGLVLMIGFEAPLARIVGVPALFAFIVIGVFLIADPAELAQDEPIRRGRSG